MQTTIGSLQWFRKFVPSFLYIIRPILDKAKKAHRLGSHAIEFSKECIQAIEKVRDYVHRVPTMHHANPEALKDIYVAMGKYAFAISIWQTIGKEKPIKELLTY